MSDVTKTGDDEANMASWMKRTAAMLARLLVETEFGPCDSDQASAAPEAEQAGD